MYNLLKVIGVAEQQRTAFGVALATATQRLPGAVTRLAAPTLPGTYNGGDFIWRVSFADRAAAQSALASEAGADVAVDRAEAVAASIRAAGGEALAIATDVSDTTALDRLADQTYAAFGEVTLLVNNAGIETLGHIWDIPAATWEKTIGINVLGVIQSVRAFAPRMIAAGKRGWIANVGSIGSFGMMPIQTSYMVSKHAVLSFSECLALEMEMIGAPISVSCVLPGPVATRIFDDAVEGDEGKASGKHRAIMADMLRAHGLTPLQAGEIILDGIAAGQFWVPTHPDMAEAMAKARADYLTGDHRPRLSDEARALL